MNFSGEDIAETLTDLLSFLQVVRIESTLRIIAADPDDDKVVECAVVGNATHIVTGDRRHLLPLRSHGGIAIVSPAVFVEICTPPAS